MFKKVSVITINLNNLEGLKRTVDSVLNQNYSVIEFLIIDGGSSDGSKQFILDNFDKIDFSLSEKDNGVYDAMNKGVHQASGDYLLFLNSGDTFCESTSVSDLITNSSGEELIYGDLNVVEENRVWTKRYPDKLNFRYFYFESLPHPACLISKNLFDRVGLYDTTLKIASDWKFFLLAISKQKATYKYVKKKISTFYFDGLSSKSENKLRTQAERVSTLKKHFWLYFSVYSIYLKLIGKSIYH